MDITTLRSDFQLLDFSQPEFFIQSYRQQQTSTADKFLASARSVLGNWLAPDPKQQKRGLQLTFWTELAGKQTVDCQGHFRFFSLGFIEYRNQITTYLLHASCCSRKRP